MTTISYRTPRLRPSGMTLIEISLVIALLLGLIAVVFLGIGSYKKGSDKARCKMQLATVQKAVRSQANFQNLDVAAAFTSAQAFGPGLALENAPICPSGGVYAWGAAIPAVGTPYGNCNFTIPGTTHVLVAATDCVDW
jgi:type II secretory pathway pseudopilin PulG